MLILLDDSAFLQTKANLTYKLATECVKEHNIESSNNGDVKKLFRIPSKAQAIDRR